jgi:hypothetical protein
VFGPHPVLLISAQPRIDRKQFIVVLKGVTLRVGQPFRVDALQITLQVFFITILHLRGMKRRTDVQKFPAKIECLNQVFFSFPGDHLQGTA